MIDITQLEKEINDFHTNILASTELLARLKDTIEVVSENTEAIRSGTTELYSAGKQQVETNRRQAEQIQKAANDLLSANAEQTRQLNAALCASVERMDSIAEQTASALRTEVGGQIQALRQNNDAVIEKAVQKIEESSVSISNQVSQIISSADSMKKTGAELIDSITAENQKASAELREANDAAVGNAVKQLSGAQETYLAELDRISELFEEQTEKLLKQYQSALRKMEDAQIDQLYELVETVKRNIDKKLTLLLGCSAVAVILGLINLFL